MLHAVKLSKRFKKDFKKVSARKGFYAETFFDFVALLQKRLSLPKEYNNHKLQGEFIGCMECHIRSDVLLIYAMSQKEQTVYLLRIGSHSDLF